MLTWKLKATASYDSVVKNVLVGGVYYTLLPFYYIYKAMSFIFMLLNRIYSKAFNVSKKVIIPVIASSCTLALFSFGIFPIINRALFIKAVSSFFGSLFIKGFQRTNKRNDKFFNKSVYFFSLFFLGSFLNIKDQYADKLIEKIASGFELAFYLIAKSSIVIFIFGSVLGCSDSSESNHSDNLLRKGKDVPLPEYLSSLLFVYSTRLQTYCLASEPDNNEVTSRNRRKPTL